MKTTDTLHLMTHRDLVSILRFIAGSHPAIFEKAVGANAPATREEIRDMVDSQGFDAAVSLVISTHDMKPSDAILYVDRIIGSASVPW